MKWSGVVAVAIMKICDSEVPEVSFSVIDRF